MNEFIIYEQPVTENIRNFLKSEYLFEKFNSGLEQNNIWGIKSSLSTLIEISDFIFRINIKIELLKELDKTKILLVSLRDDNKIKDNKYEEFISSIETCIDNLNSISNSPSKTIVNNDFLMQIKNKSHIPAGDNFFDMPSYLNFLSSNKTFIFDNINSWYKPFEPIFLASQLIIDIKRRNSKFCSYRCSESFFEKKLDKTVKIDLVRIKIEKNSNIFPDVSVNPQNINIIFKSSHGSDRISKVITEDINFELSLSTSR
jgi:cell division protein ZapD